MARLKLELPTVFPFQTHIKVRITDLNYGQHVANDVFLAYMHQARMEFFHKFGYINEKDLEGVGIILADSMVIYKSEIFYGDTLKAEVTVADIEKYGFDLVYKLTSLNSGKEAARGKTGIVCFDYTHRKISEIPAKLKEKLLQ